MSIITSTLKREWLLLLRDPQSYLQGILFFSLVIFIFSFVLENQTNMYLYIWIAAMLSQLLSVDALFKADYADGSLDQFLLQKNALPYLIIAKLLPHILLQAGPLVLLTALLGLVWGLELKVMFILMSTLLLGMPILFLLGSLGAALTVSVKNSSLLTGIILLPLYVPALLFAITSVQSSALGLSWQGPMALLGAEFILTLILCPLASAAILKVTAA